MPILNDDVTIINADGSLTTYDMSELRGADDGTSPKADEQEQKGSDG